MSGETQADGAAAHGIVTGVPQTVHAAAARLWAGVARVQDWLAAPLPDHRASVMADWLGGLAVDAESFSFQFCETGGEVVPKAPDSRQLEP